MLDVRLYMLQRLSALLMAPFVLIHLGVMIYAVQGGLSAAEILGRTRGSVFWFAFYSSFVLAASVHAAIGLRVVVYEWLRISGTVLTVVMWASGLMLLFMGARAVWAVTGGGA